MRLLTDPVLGRRVGPLRRYAEPVDAAAVSGVDAVLLSHFHADHADLPSLRRVGRDTRVIAPAAVARWLRRHGFAHATAVGAGDRAHVGGVVVEAVRAEHDGRRHPGGRRGEALGFLAGGVYFAGDTDLFGGMAALAGRATAALLPVWGWGPRLPPGHLDPERAARAAALVAPRVAIPIHWGTLAPRWARPPDPAAAAGPPRAFAEACARLAPEVEVRVLRPGERWCGHPGPAGAPEP